MLTSLKAPYSEAASGSEPKEQTILDGALSDVQRQLSWLRDDLLTLATQLSPVLRAQTDDKDKAAEAYTPSSSPLIYSLEQFTFNLMAARNEISDIRTRLVT